MTNSKKKKNKKKEIIHTYYTRTGARFDTRLDKDDIKLRDELDMKCPYCAYPKSGDKWIFIENSTPFGGIDHVCPRCGRIEQYA